MAFVEVTDRERILELNAAGLLWDSVNSSVPAGVGETADYVLNGRYYKKEWDGPFHANWDPDNSPITDVLEDSDWKFYILLED